MSCFAGAMALAAVAFLGLSARATAAEPPRRFRVEQRSGTWWFVSPENRPFVSIGMNHLEPVLLLGESNRNAWAQKLGGSPADAEGRPDNTSPAARRWVDESVELISGWSFNTLGMHNPVPQNKLPYVGTFRPYPIDGWHGLKRQFPDPFDAGTARETGVRAKAWCAAQGADPLLLGVTFNDMPIWRVEAASYHPWVAHLMGLPAEAAGKRQWLEVLAERHESPAEAAATYGVQASSWSDLARLTAWPRPADAAKSGADQVAMLARIAEAWYGTVSRAVRSCAPGVLIFGDKLSGPEDLPEWLDPIVGRHFDVVFIQWYATAEQQRGRLRRLHAASGKPILMGDSSFSSPSPGVPHPKGVRLGSQAEVGRAYEHYLRTILREPYVVGWHFCGFIEGSRDLGKFHPYFTFQNGLLKADGSPYAETVAAVRRANAQAQEWHARDPGPDAAPLPCQQTLRAKGEVFQVGENVFVVRINPTVVPGPPNKTVSFIVTSEGAVAIDTGFAPTAELARQVLREITDRPLRYIIYSHHHIVHGAATLKEPGTRVIAHEDTALEFDLIRDQYASFARLNSIQFDNEPPRDPRPQEFVYPDMTYRDRAVIQLGGERIELIHAVGEADDYTIVHLPAQGIVWVGDLVAHAIPMVASPMKPVRSAVRWRRAIETIEKLAPRVLINQVSPPECDPAVIARQLSDHRRFLAFIHEAVSREINRGSTVDEAVARIRMPEDLAASPYMQPAYGNLEFAVRGLYHEYLGWFDRNGTHLRPEPRAITAARFVASMGGRDRVLEQARELASDGSYQGALEFLDLLIDAKSDDEARAWKAVCLEHLAADSAGLTANMYRRLAANERATVLEHRGPEWVAAILGEAPAGLRWPWWLGGKVRAVVAVLVLVAGALALRAARRRRLQLP
jgi:glyoxylase-like metal-dependent hydrolase (beta-lactamase superfamily II)